MSHVPKIEYLITLCIHFPSDLYLEQTYAYFDMFYYMAKGLINIFCLMIKFMFFKKATKIDEIFTVDLTLCSKCEIDGEDFVNFLRPS